jgi:hypothetical protein
MRKTDWADAIANEVYDYLAADVDDDVLVRIIGEKLRKAFALGLGQTVLTNSRHTSQGGDVSNYVVTVARGSKVAAIDNSDLSRFSAKVARDVHLMLTYTWDGEPSKKVDNDNSRSEED